MIRPLSLQTPALQGDDVLELQHRLNALKLSVQTTGVYDEQTSAAVSKFCQANGLPAQSCDEQTIKAILALDPTQSKFIPRQSLAQKLGVKQQLFDDMEKNRPISIRPLNDTDEQLFVQLLSYGQQQNDHMRYEHAALTPDQARLQFQRCCQRMHRAHPIAWLDFAVFNGGTFCGCVDVRVIDDTVHVGVTIVAEQSNKGAGRTACGILLKLFQRCTLLKICKIRADTYRENAAAVKMLKDLNFKIVSEKREISGEFRVLQTWERWLWNTDEVEQVIK